MGEDRAKKSVGMWEPSGKRRVGRPRYRCKDEVQKDLSTLQITNWREVALDRDGWCQKVLVAKILFGSLSQGILSVLLQLIHRDMSMPRLTIDDMPVLGEKGEGFDRNCSSFDCPRIYAPVCAYDNKTYVNECKLYCINVKKRKKRNRYHIKYYGPCMPFRRFNNFMFIFTPNDTVYERMILVDNETVLQEVLDLREMAEMEYVPSFEMWKYLVNQDLVMTHSNDDEEL